MHTVIFPVKSTTYGICWWCQQFRFPFPVNIKRHVYNLVNFLKKRIKFCKLNVTNNSDLPPNVTKLSVFTVQSSMNTLKEHHKFRTKTVISIISDYFFVYFRPAILDDQSGFQKYYTTFFIHLGLHTRQYIMSGEEVSAYSCLLNA